MSETETRLVMAIDYECENSTITMPVASGQWRIAHCSEMKKNSNTCCTPSVNLSVRKPLHTLMIELRVDTKHRDWHRLALAVTY